MSDPTETLEFAGPVSDGWYRTQIPDWIALHPELKDGSFRLFCILRALILEKQKNRIRVLSHEQIAFLAVGKNGKPASISTIKALLANLQEVGLISNPDGSRIVTSSGPGSIQTRRRYQLSDWPTASSSYTGWRNAFDKLDAFTDDWRDSRTDVSRGRVDSQKTDPRSEQGEQDPSAGQLEGQFSDRPGQNSDVDGQNSGENPPLSSGDASSLKELPEGVALTSSSSAELEGTAPVAEKKTKKITKKSAEDIVLEQLAHMTPTLEEADAVVTLVIAKAAAKGTRVENPTRWIDGRDKRVLEQDLEDVRRASRVALSGECVLHEVSLESGACSSCMGDIKAGDAEAIRAHLLEVGADSRPDLAAVLGAPHVPAQATAGGWTWEDQLRRERRARNGVRGGVTEPVPDHTYWETVTDEQLKASL